MLKHKSKFASIYQYHAIAYMIRCCGACLLAIVALHQAAHGAEGMQPVSVGDVAGTDGSLQHEQGRGIYNFRCYYCHGYSGNAKTLASTYLEPRPRDFTAPEARGLSRERMIEAVTQGRPGTAMKGFNNTLSKDEIAKVVDFVRNEFIRSRLENTFYHVAENGWDGHEQYRIAFPFATGELALDTPWNVLSPLQRQGKRLFMGSCISCHDRAKINDEGAVWDAQAVSYPRFDFKPGDYLLPPDSISGASPFSKHDVPKRLPLLSDTEKIGEQIFQDNCAFCHGADGTGKNWIGTFLEPHAGDLTSSELMSGMTRGGLRKIIEEGVVGTSMPAWRHVLSSEQIEAVIAYIDRVFHKLVDNSKILQEMGYQDH